MSKEQELNRIYSETFTEEQIIDNFIYLTNKSRGKHTTVSHLKKCYYTNKIGSLLKRLDPIAFNCN